MGDAGAIAITRYPAARGALWLREAFGMLSRARGRWLMLVLLYYLIMAIVDVLPVIGRIAVPMLKPVFAVGFLAAAWSQERGEPPRLRQLFQGFRANLFALLPLGVLLIVAATIGALATMLVDGGALLQVLSGRMQVDEATLLSGSLQGAMVFGFVCVLPALLALWYAPALVVFHGCSAAHALLFSLRASLVNWRALTVYMLLVLFYGVIVPGLAMAAIGLMVPGNAALAIALTALLPYFLFMIATLHISDYVSYRDIFHAGEKATTG